MKYTNNYDNNSNCNNNNTTYRNSKLERKYKRKEEEVLQIQLNEYTNFFLTSIYRGC